MCKPRLSTVDSGTTYEEGAMPQYRLLTLLLWIAVAVAFATGRSAAVGTRRSAAVGQAAVANDPRTAVTGSLAHEYALHRPEWRMR